MFKRKKEKEKEKKIISQKVLQSSSESSPAGRTTSSENQQANIPKREEEKESEVTEEGLIFVLESGKRNVKGGNIVKLVELLTHHSESNQQYLQAFMLTFRSFTTPNELLDLLFARFSIEPPENLEGGIDAFNVKLKGIRLRVSNVLKHWISKGFYDFEGNGELLKKLGDFINNVMVPAMGNTQLSPAVNLLNLLKRQQNPEERKKEREKFLDKPPMPHLPKNVTTKEKLTVLSYHPEEIARQLTLIDFQLFASIKPFECLNQNWMKAAHDDLSPNVMKMIRRFNEVSGWIASEILKFKDLPTRTKALKQIIEIAEFCKNLNNYNSVLEIISGLQSSAVFRLKQTWAGLSKNYVKSFEDMCELVSQNRNYYQLRLNLHNANPPCIPYLGVYLTDLTFIEEGNKDFLQDGSINFAKRRRLAEVISEIQRYQDVVYCLEEVSFIKEYLLGFECLPQEQCYKLSLKREGRGGGTANEEQDEDEPFGEMEVIKEYQFDQKDTEDSIILEKECPADTPYVPVASASLLKLVERLTYQKYQDIDFVSTYLMSLNTFTTPIEVFKLLRIRHNIPKPKNPSTQQMDQFARLHLYPMHLRIYNVVKSWINSYIEDFIGNEELISMVNQTLTNWSASNFAKAVENIKTLFAKKLEEGNGEAENIIIIGSSNNNTENNPAEILQYEVGDLAQQICLFEFEIFSKIKPREVLFVHDPNQLKQMSPNIFALRKNFEQTKYWATSEFLKQTDSESRVKVLSHFILLSDKLIQLKNYNSSMAIIAGIKLIQNELENSLIWSFVSPSVLSAYKQLEQIYKNPSSIKLKKSQSCIPFFDTYIKQLITIHEKPDTINQLVNFQKRRHQYDIYKLWNSFVQEPYSFQQTKSRDYLLSVKIYSAVEIRRKAESIERVADIKGARALRTESDSDSAHEKGENYSIVKSSMISLMTEEKDILQDIINEAKKELAKDLMSELKKYTECVRDEIALSNNELGLPNNAESAAERIMLRIFPGALIVPITEVDKEGTIFGWEEEFTLYQVDDFDDKFIVYITPKLAKSDLSTAFKVFNYFNDFVVKDDRTKIILTAKCSDDSRVIATRFGISITCFN